MKVDITLSELEKRLNERVVCNVLEDLNNKAQMWNKGGALIHRVRATGYMAQSGIKNIKDGMTPINDTSTFEEMRVIAKKMYDETIGFLYTLAKSGIYIP